MEQHKGGKIWCESKGEGHGCTFTIELPALDAGGLTPEEARGGRRPSISGAQGFSPLMSPALSPRGSVLARHDGSQVGPCPCPFVRPGNAWWRSHPGTPTHLSTRHRPQTARRVTSAQLLAAAGANADTLPPGLHVLVVDDSETNRKVSALTPI